MITENIELQVLNPTVPPPTYSPSDLPPYELPESYSFPKHLQHLRFTIVFLAIVVFLCGVFSCVVMVFGTIQSNGLVESVCSTNSTTVCVLHKKIEWFCSLCNNCETFFHTTCFYHPCYFNPTGFECTLKNTRIGGIYNEQPSVIVPSISLTVNIVTLLYLCIVYKFSSSSPDAFLFQLSV